MSMQRALLRTAAIQALTGTTIAGARVYDTRIAPLQTGIADQPLPMIAVYTDIDRRKNSAHKAPTPVFVPMIDLVIEISIGAWQMRQAVGEGNPELVFGYLACDAEMELKLDLFENQIRRRFAGPYTESARLQGIVKAWHDWESVPGRDPDGNGKFSARMITATVEVSDDCMPRWDGRRSALATNPIAETAPYLIPALQDIATYPEFASMRDMLAEMLGEAELPPVDRLKVFKLTVDFLGEDGLPDGRPEIIADVQT